MGLKIVSVVGARPQFIKASPVSKALRKKHKEFLVHTGQHYDENMSRLFFQEMNIPEPDVNLEIGSGSHAQQTGQMMIGLEKILQQQNADFVLVYGDTNSTLAASVTASKLGIPVAHVEAGLRSFNRAMPEEVNRVLTDKISNVLFCPTQISVDHLRNEGITSNVFLIGDVMYDAVQQFKKIAGQKSEIFSILNLEPKDYVLVTCHRAENTNDPARMQNIVGALAESAKKVVFPVHPRTVGFLQKYDFWKKLTAMEHIKIIEPVGYLDMIQLEQHAEKIVTDSGGVQKEAYFFGVPCITMRDETEWIETVQDGWNLLTGASKEKIVQAINTFSPVSEQKQHYGKGNAGELIAQILDDKYDH